MDEVGVVLAFEIALADGDWIIGAVLLDLFRNPKTYAYEGTKAATQPRIISIRVRPRNVYAQHGTKIEITGVNEMDAIKGSLKVEIASGDGGIVFTQRIATNLVSGITQVFSEKFDTRAFKGTCTVTAEIIADEGRQLPETRTALTSSMSGNWPFPRDA